VNDAHLADIRTTPERQVRRQDDTTTVTFDAVISALDNVIAEGRDEPWRVR
jgi:hypothetical protein